MSNIVLKNKKISVEKLLNFGFTENSKEYIYTVDILEGQFNLTVSIENNRQIRTKIIDKATNDEYVLHSVPTACGEFVGKVRAEYESILNDITEKCFESDVFKSEYAKMIINYIKEKYQNEFEFLWERFSDNAIVRRSDNKKWYALLLVLSKRKLGLDNDETIDVLDVRIKTEKIDSIINNINIFPGYHMNKKHWFTICLDGTVAIEKIYDWIDESYEIANKK